MEKSTIIQLSISCISTLLIIIITAYTNWRGNKKLENLKSLLDLQSNNQKILFVEKKDAIYNFLTSYNLWLYEIDNLTNYEYSDYLKLNKLASTLDNKYNKVISELTKFELFIKDSNLEISSKNLLKLTKELQQINLNFYGGFQHYLYEINDLYETLKEGNVVVHQHAESIDNGYKEHCEIYSKLFEPKLVLVQKSKDIFITNSKLNMGVGE